jgi:hypothetical protein
MNQRLTASAENRIGGNSVSRNSVDGIGGNISAGTVFGRATKQQVLRLKQVDGHWRKTVSRRLIFRATPWNRGLMRVNAEQRFTQETHTGIGISVLRATWQNSSFHGTVFSAGHWRNRRNRFTGTAETVFY